ncbi:hypothetical protein ABPG73_022673 [Tetrahymena malaccensis]
MLDILKIFVLSIGYQPSITFEDVEADLASDNNIQFLILNGQKFFFLMSNSKITNGSSKNFGGCLYFDSSFKVSAYIQNTTFKRCKSKFLGGAISGIQNIRLKNVNFIECSSQIGGAIYTLTSDNLPQEYFSQNTGYLAASNYNRDRLQISIQDVLEINQSSDNVTDLFLQTDGYLYPGLTYILRLQISVDGEDYKNFTDKNFFGNLYEFLDQPSKYFISNTPPQLSSINFPYLLWCAQDISFHKDQTKQLGIINISFSELIELNTAGYKIFNGCKDQGMEKVFYQNNQQFICKYCQKMQVSNNGVCQNCPYYYFSDCYGNNSVLKQFYWRSNNSVDPKDIFYCFGNPQNCQGGSGIGNELCYEGHIGPQCLACDVYGSYWRERYSTIGFFQCLDTNFNNNSITFEDVEADLASDNNIQFLILNGQKFFFLMSNSKITNGSSTNFGGCLYFDSSFKVSAYIQNSTFKRCKSKFLGGAISGIQNVRLKNVNFIECSSQIGGAIYTLTSDNLPQEYFSQNTGYLAASNYNRDRLQISIQDILEINQSSDNVTDLFLQTDGYLYPGLTYILRLQISVDGEDYKNFTDKNFFGNLYEFLDQPSKYFISNTPPQLSSINFPYLLWCAQDISFHKDQTKQLGIINISFSELIELNTAGYKIFNGCKDQGMEKVFYQNNQQFICKYCQKMQVSNNGVCQNCPYNYFSDCYGNNSVLKQFYWRSNNSVDPKDIFYCFGNPQNCQGGSGIGNELCYEGHIGPQCLACDVYGSYWRERYSTIGFFQCL